MAEIYDRLGKKEEAIQLYKKAFKMPVLSADDKEVHETVIVLLYLFLFCKNKKKKFLIINFLQLAQKIFR